MSNLLINISQMQAVTLLAQAQASLNLVVQAFQQAIAGAQASGAGTVTLSSDLLQSIAAQIQLAAEAVVQARVRQMQMIMVRLRGDTDVMVRLRQMQIANVLAQSRASLDATLRAVQRLQTQAQAMGGSVSVSLADAQSLLASIQAVVTAVAQATVAQQQNLQIITQAAQAGG